MALIQIVITFIADILEKLVGAGHHIIAVIFAIAVAVRGIVGTIKDAVDITKSAIDIAKFISNTVRSWWRWMRQAQASDQRPADEANTAILTVRYVQIGIAGEVNTALPVTPILSSAAPATIPS